MQLVFEKYQGTGNDFIILDNRDGQYSVLQQHQIAFLCDRKFGIGADGLMLMNASVDYDFEMVYYNADGKTSSMCGNGGRCMVQFAARHGIHRYTYRFIAVDGMHEAEIAQNGQIRLKMQDVHQVAYHAHHMILDTGSPHLVQFVQHLHDVDVFESGRNIRYSDAFRENGINVNFAEEMSDGVVHARTYERGVEDETLSCGTGVTAVALMAAHNEKAFNQVLVKTPGGTLSVEFTKHSDQHFTDIWLCGPAEQVFSGTIDLSKKIVVETSSSTNTAQS
jgi:diaminopimelate epimerase